MSTVLIKKEKFCYSVKLNRPDKHNAFNPEMIKELTEFFIGADKDKFAGAILLSGAGASFCSGGDLEWMKSMAQFKFEENIEDARALYNMYAAAAQCSLPIVGYLHGSVYGGGLGLAAICDIAIAEATTQFCFSEVKIGLVPAVISSFVLKKMDENKAREFMMTARVFDAEAAQSAGLIEFSGRELEIQEYRDQTIHLLGKSGPEAVRETKKLLNKLQKETSDTVREDCIRVISERRVSPEGQEGLKSFLEKRKPAWLWSAAEADEGEK